MKALLSTSAHFQPNDAQTISFEIGGRKSVVFFFKKKSSEIQQQRKLIFWKTDCKLCAVSLTQGEQGPVVLRHHIPVQGPLGGAQACPLLLGEFYGHIPECQGHLK